VTNSSKCQADVPLLGFSKKRPGYKEWLTPVIVAIWETEIKKIMFQSHPR
jgi:hypothetical protein